MLRKHKTLSFKVGTNDTYTISDICRISLVLSGDVSVCNWLSYKQHSIPLTPRWNYRSKDKQYYGKGKVYRTKINSARGGPCPVTVLCKHECDMRDNPDSLTTEFIMETIEGFKREPIKK